MTAYLSLETIQVRRHRSDIFKTLKKIPANLEINSTPGKKITFKMKAATK